MVLFARKRIPSNWRPVIPRSLIYRVPDVSVEGVGEGEPVGLHVLGEGGDLPRGQVVVMHHILVLVQHSSHVPHICTSTTW